MLIEIHSIREKFDELFTDACSREEASNWARNLRRTIDRFGDEIEFDSQCESIMKAIAFLEGYDLKISPTEYLYDAMDLKNNRP